MLHIFLMVSLDAFKVILNDLENRTSGCKCFVCKDITTRQFVICLTLIVMLVFMFSTV